MSERAFAGAKPPVFFPFHNPSQTIPIGGDGAAKSDSNSKPAHSARGDWLRIDERMPVSLTF